VWKIAVTLATSLGALGAAQAAALTELEIKWLKAAEPVLVFAQRQQLPIDIIVQPQARATDVPLAMGFDKGRCKLVLSLRGNPEAEAQLKGIPAAEQALLIEAMAAHELGHCIRYAQGVWHELPKGFVEHSEEQGRADLLALSKQQRETRREEAFADMFALAWVHAHHQADYARVYTWLNRLRADQPVPLGAHDTRKWVRLATAAAFDSRSSAADNAQLLWRKGLTHDD
jgi:hypothetical protein